jgi:hypothetical protein
LPGSGGTLRRRPLKPYVPLIAAYGSSKPYGVRVVAVQAARDGLFVAAVSYEAGVGWRARTPVSDQIVSGHRFAGAGGHCSTHAGLWFTIGV